MQKPQPKKWKVNENSTVKEVEEVFIKKGLVIKDSVQTITCTKGAKKK